MASGAGRDFRRRDVGALEHLLADHELDHRAVDAVLDVVPDMRDAHLAELVVAIEADLQEHAELLVAQPVAALRLDARPVPAAGADHLAALHGEPDLGGAVVAGDDLVFRAGGLSQHIGVVVRGFVRRHRAERHLLGAHVVEAFHAGGRPADADAGAVIGGAEILHAHRIEQDLRLLLEQRPHHCARHDAGDDGAVLGRDLGEEAGGAAGAGARHVLDHDAGLARDVTVEVARQRAAVDVVAAGRAGADDEVDAAAGVVVLRRGRRGQNGTERGAGDKQRPAIF